jgi:hypothetical protein
MRFPRFLFIWILILPLVFTYSCGPHKVCSGLNQELGKNDTKKRLRKNGRKLKSKPERDSHRRRKVSVKRQGHDSSKRHAGGIFRLRIGRSGRSGNASIQKK